MSAWLPDDAEPAEGTELTSGLTGECWNSVFRQSQFAHLLQEILGHPADVVMLQLRCHER